VDRGLMLVGVHRLLGRSCAASDSLC
jgi:hypothetical protein